MQAVADACGARILGFLYPALHLRFRGWQQVCHVAHLRHSELYSEARSRSRKHDERLQCLSLLASHARARATAAQSSAVTRSWHVTHHPSPQGNCRLWPRMFSRSVSARLGRLMLTKCRRTRSYSTAMSRSTQCLLSMPHKHQACTTRMPNATRAMAHSGRPASRPGFLLCDRDTTSTPTRAVQSEKDTRHSVERRSAILFQAFAQRAWMTSQRRFVSSSIPPDGFSLSFSMAPITSGS